MHNLWTNTKLLQKWQNTFTIRYQRRRRVHLETLQRTNARPKWTCKQTAVKTTVCNIWLKITFAEKIFQLTPRRKTALTGLWSLRRKLGWLRYSSWLMLSPYHRMRSHHDGVRFLALKHRSIPEWRQNYGINAWCSLSLAFRQWRITPAQ